MEKSKTNKGLVVMVVILSIALLGAIGYICYDKFMVKVEDPKQEEPKQEEKLSEEEVNNLRKGLILDEEYGMQASLYFDHNVSIDTMSDELVNYLIKKHCDQNQVSSKIDSWMKEHNNDVSSGDSVIYSFYKQELANILKSTFNTDKDLNIKESTDYIYMYNSNGIKYNSNDEMLNVVSSINPSEPGTIQTKMTKYDQQNNEVYVYEKVMLCYYGQSFDSNGCTNSHGYFVKITDDSKIMSNNGENRTFNYDYIFENYSDKLNTYKTTFKKADDGKYYWYSSEIVNE